jgi:phage terminase large subunit
MQRENYLVTKKSINLINELQKYTWAKDKKTGQKLNKPIENFNHAIDAVRYHEMETVGGLTKTFKTKAYVRAR